MLYREICVLQSEEDNEIGNLGELSFSSKKSTKAEEAGKQGSEGDELGWSSEKPEAWPTDGPDCEADHLASYGVINTMDLVEFTNLSLMLCTLLVWKLKFFFQFGGAYSPVMRPIAILGPSGAAPILSDPAVLACGVIKEEDVILDQKCDRKYNIKPIITHCRSKAKKTKGILRCMKGRHTERVERAKTASFLKSPISLATRKGENE